MLLRDISPRKLVEREVAANLKRERELSELKSHFVSVASHEFRTPLAGAVGCVDMLDRYGDRLTPEKRAEVLRRLKNSHRRLIDIMDNVLTVSRAEVGRIQVEPVPTDLRSFVQDTIDEVTVSDQGRHRIALQWAGADPVVQADQKLMHHIVSNLLANAARYSPEGTTIHVSAAAEDGHFSVTVADEGIGVPEADRGRIFEPFVRGSNVGEASGTGLGLNIVKRYCEVMGGKVELLPGERGASFRVEIPFAKGEGKGA